MQERIKLARRLWAESKHRPVPGIEWIQAYVTDVEELERRNERLERALRRWVLQVEKGGGVETRAYVMAKNELRGPEIEREKG